VCRRMGVFCADDLNCKIDGDCASGSCVGSYDAAGVLSGSKKCVSCYNSVKDGTESDTEYVFCGCSCCCCCCCGCCCSVYTDHFFVLNCPQLRWQPM
jgi:hypothetical protein